MKENNHVQWFKVESSPIIISWISRVKLYTLMYDLIGFITVVFLIFFFINNISDNSNYKWFYFGALFSTVTLVCVSLTFNYFQLKPFDNIGLSKDGIYKERGRVTYFTPWEKIKTIGQNHLKQPLREANIVGIITSLFIILLTENDIRTVLFYIRDMDIHVVVDRSFKPFANAMGITRLTTWEDKILSQPLGSFYFPEYKE